jgi:Domain of unknown function (DUF4167)
MRPSNKSRSRNKPSNGNQSPRRSVGNIINRVFDSAGPDGKVRGTPQQIIDKYNVLARDAQLSGDRVAAENYLQHAEHYSRLLGEAQRQVQEQRQAQEQRDTARRDDPQQRRSNGHEAEASDSTDESALATFDTGGAEDVSGPVDTPEDRRNADRSADAASAEEKRNPARRRNVGDASPDSGNSGGEDAPQTSESSRPSVATPDIPEAPQPAEAGAEGDTAEEKPAPKKRARRKPRTKAASSEETGSSESAEANGESAPEEAAPSDQTAAVEQ